MVCLPPMNCPYLCFLPLLCLPVSWLAGESTAQLRMYSLSFELDSHVNPFGSIVYFTTYDGLAGQPLAHNDNISEEVSPSPDNPSIYVADYMVFGNSEMISYGSMSFRMPTQDSNGNGVYDWLEAANAVNFSVAGTLQAEWPTSVVATIPFNAVFQRNAGDSVGTVSYSYDLVIVDDTISVSNVTSWGITNLVGDFTYGSSGDTALGVSALAYGGLFTLAGEGSYSSSSADVVRINQMQVTDTVNNFILETMDLGRSGNIYSGVAALDDGIPSTPWEDFTDWYVILTDTNDGDGDGIPDLTDSVQSGTGTFTPDGWNYFSWPWAYSQADQGWLYFSAAGGNVLLWRQKDGKWYQPQDSLAAWLVVE